MTNRKIVTVNDLGTDFIIDPQDKLIELNVDQHSLLLDENNQLRTNAVDHDIVTSSVDGLLSKEDKQRLDVMISDYIERHQTLKSAVQISYSTDVTISEQSQFEYSYNGVAWRRGLIRANSPVYVRNSTTNTIIHNLPERDLITEIHFWGDEITQLSLIGGTQLVSVPDDLPKNVVSLYQMFEGCTSFNQNLKWWDVSNVTNMGRMFYGATSFNQDLSLWCVSKISSLPNSFNDSGSLGAEQYPVWGTCPIRPELVLEFNGTDPSKSITISNAMSLSIHRSDTNETKTLTGTFGVSIPELDIPQVGTLTIKDVVLRDGYDTHSILSLVNQMNLVTIHSYGDLPFTGLDHRSCSNLTSVPDRIPPTVANLSLCFYDCSNFNDSTVKDWDTGNVTYMYGMFYGATSFNQDISNWDVSKVTNMSNMFSNASGFNQDLSNWCVTNILEEPNNFDTNTPNWVKEDRLPVWGTCPRGEDQN